jgi:hypothetical protein
MTPPACAMALAVVVVPVTGLVDVVADTFWKGSRSPLQGPRIREHMAPRPLTFRLGENDHPDLTMALAATG